MSGSIYDTAGSQWDIDPLLLRAIERVESGGNVAATSLAGAQGNMQFMPATANGVGVADPRNAAFSVPGAAKLLSDLLSGPAKGNPITALRMYQGGPDTSKWGVQNAAYPQKVAAAYQALRSSGVAPAVTKTEFNPATMSDDELDKALRGSGSPPGVEPKAPEPAPANPATMSDEELHRTLAGEATPGTPPPAPGEFDPLTGQKVQSASAGNNSPVAQTLGKLISEQYKPGVGTQAAINLATDPDQRRRIAAAQLFPDLPRNEALSRIFYGDDGRLAAVDRYGNPFYIDPSPPRVDLSKGKVDLGNPLLYAASGAPGAAAPLAAATAGVLAAPGSLVVGPLAAGGAAAATDVGRQMLARQFDPLATAPQPLNLAQTEKEAALSAAGQLGGSFASRVLAPNPLRLPVTERNMLVASPAMADARNAYARAGAQGVQLTPGQATGLPSLLQYEDAATTMPGTSDIAAQFYRNQGHQLQSAGQNMLSSVSPLADKTAGAASFQGGAEDAIRLARQNANAAARPAYEAAANAGQVMSPDLAQLSEQPAVKKAMDAARTAYQNLYRVEAPETPDFALWDLTKRKLDDAHDIAMRAGERTDAMSIDTLRGDLRTNLDAAYPTYATARATAAPGQQLASQLEESGVGTVAGKTGDEKARAILAPVFAQDNPQAVARARDAFVSVGRGDEWNNGVRAYVQDAFDRAGQSQTGLNPSRLRRDIWGNVDNRAALQAAMTPTQFDGFDNFLRTIEDTARTYPMNSLTATRGNAGAALQSAAANQGNVHAINTAATVLSPFGWTQLGNIAFSGVRQRMVQRNMNQIVQYLFSPDGLQYLEAMSRHSPGSLKAMETGAQLMTRALPSALVAPSANENNPLSGQAVGPQLSGGGR